MKTVESLPDVQILTSLRSVGYSEEEAIADIIDNSIAADATEINIFFDSKNRWIFITDNGFGMSQKELILSMSLGCINPETERDETDLGRFGMGLKTAAFSLGKTLTVISKTEDDAYANATWDLTKIKEIGWKLIIESFPESFYTMAVPEHGTCVWIKNCDHVFGPEGAEVNKTKLYKHLEHIRSHIAMTFHRFMEEDDITITLQQNPIEPWNPFCFDSFTTDIRPQQTVYVPEHPDLAIQIQPVVLPHKTKFDSEGEYQAAGGPYGWIDQQGCYLYRNKRLIVSRTWFRLIRKDPTFQLARILIDIPNQCDFDWNIDIKKTTATPPVYIKEALKKAIDDCTKCSQKIYNSRGSYTPSATHQNDAKLDYVWALVQKSKRSTFRINRQHPLLQNLKKKIPKEQLATLETFLMLLETNSPWEKSLLSNKIQEVTEAPASRAEQLEEARTLSELETHIKELRSNGYMPHEIKAFFATIPSFKSILENHPDIWDASVHPEIWK